MDVGCYFILLCNNGGASLRRDHGLLAEELLQHADDAAGFRKAAVFGSSVLQQHVSVPAALQEEAAAEQSVVAHFCLTDKSLQVVHVLDGLFFLSTHAKAHDN